MTDKCNCHTCQRYRLYLEYIKRVPEDDRQFWEKIFDALYNAEADCDYWEASCKGLFRDGSEKR